MAVKLYPVENSDAQLLVLGGDDVDLTAEAGPTGGYSARGFYVTGAGNLKIKSLAGSILTLDIAAKTFVWIAAQYVYSTANGTTATGVFAIL